MTKLTKKELLFTHRALRLIRHVKDRYTEIRGTSLTIQELGVSRQIAVLCELVADLHHDLDSRIERLEREK